MSRRLTVRQVQVVQMIRGYTVDHGYPPTLREITVSFGWASVRAAACHLEALERKGAIRRDPARARAIQVLSVGDD